MSNGKISYRNSEYWQRLRRDLRSNGAAGAAALAMIFCVLPWIHILVPGNQFQTRANPLYWMLMLPGAYWFANLIRFKPWAVVIMRSMYVLAPFAAGGALAYTAAVSPADNGPPAVLLALSCIASIVGYLLYRRSLLRQEGPFMEAD